MKIQNVVSKRLRPYTLKPLVLQGVLGDLVTGVVEVPGRSSIVYVTLNSGVQLSNVLNTRVPNVFGLPVSVGFDPVDQPYTLRVLSARDMSAIGVDNPGNGIGWHHKQHEWPYGDTTYIWGPQFMPSLYLPHAGELSVDIYPGTYIILTGEKVYTQVTNVSLAAAAATVTPEHAMFAAIVVDSAGVFQVRSGALVAAQVTPYIAAYAMLADTDLPTLTLGDTPICAVRLYYGQLEFYCNGQRNDFIDLRFARTMAGGGTGGGDVYGDASGVNGHVVLFDGDGYTLKDGGVPPIAGHEIIDENGDPVDQEPAIQFTGDVEVTDDAGVKTIVNVVATNHLFIDQSGGTGDSYGVLVGDLDGANTDYTVSQGTYETGTLHIYLNGQLLTQGSGEDWIELVPGSGTFQMNVAPEATDQLTVVYGFAGTVAGPIGPQGIPGPTYPCTSTSSIAIGTGSKTFVTQAGLAYNTASRVHIVSDADPDANWMEGLVTSYSGTSLVVDVDYILGSGTHTDWTISLIGNIKAAVHHQQFIWTVDGSYISSAEEGVMPLVFFMAYVGAGAIIEEVKIHIGVSPTTDNVRIRILKNGSTIFTDTDYVEVATGDNDASRTTDFASSGACDMDDYFQWELVQGDVDAANVTIQLRYKWTLTGL